MSRRRRESPELSANLTPLIDVTFLLIVFFVLVSRVNEVERWVLDLPAPKDALTEPPEDEHRVVINVIPAPIGGTGAGSMGGNGGIAGYHVGVAEFAADEAGIAMMTDHLASLYHINPGINVNIRADRLTHYEFVEPAMQAVATAARRAAAAGAGNGAAGVNPRVNLVVAKGG